MTNVAIIRCEKNEDRCPLTGGIMAARQETQGFAGHVDPVIMGVFTCRCPGYNVGDLARILKAKGAEVIHFPTCLFSSKRDGVWFQGNGFCDRLEEIVKTACAASGLPCVLGTAHLPEGYEVRVLSPEA